VTDGSLGPALDNGNPSSRVRSYRDLVVWQKAMLLTRLVYQTSSFWPPEERFGLISQARRAAVSIPANLAEGQGRIGSKEFARFVAIAHGSLCELETELTLAHELGFCSEADIAHCLALAGEVGRMCRSLIAKNDARFEANKNRDGLPLRGTQE
jgi:four helix bundle protein